MRKEKGINSKQICVTLSGTRKRGKKKEKKGNSKQICVTLSGTRKTGKKKEKKGNNRGRKKHRHEHHIPPYEGFQVLTTHCNVPAPPT